MGKMIKELFEDGKILEEYGKTHFLTITPCPLIERVRFSIMKIGDKGKNPSDFYLPYPDMITLCEDILSPNMIFAKKCTEDANNKYPGAYKYVTGKDGSKKLNIGGGQKGVRIQTIITGANGISEIRSTAVSYNSIRCMALYFQYIIGLRPSSYYISELVSIFYETSNSRKTSLSKDDSINDVSPSEESSSNEPLPEEHSFEENESKLPDEDLKLKAPKAIKMYCVTEIKKTKRGHELGCKVCNNDMTMGNNIYTVCIKNDAEISKDQFIRLRDTIKEKLSDDDKRPPLISFTYEKDDSSNVTYLLKLLTNEDLKQAM